MVVRTIEVRERLMARNDQLATQIRERLRLAQVPALNLISSPGSGKTALLERTLEAVGPELDLAVVTGDVQTQNDADRLARHTDQVVQAVVTGGACHLDAAQITDAIGALDLGRVGMLLIENVGNLVCPASWDLGEEAKVVLVSVTEGEDKPLKYPKAFQQARYLVLTKTDLLPYLSLDPRELIANALRVNDRLECVMTSAITGEGLNDWFNLLRQWTPARGRR